MRCLVTGATGYVGGRLYPALRAAGHDVRLLSRRPDELRARLGAAADVVGGDVRDATSLDTALRGVDVAYYLVHSMGQRGSFAAADREAAATFGAAARRAGVRRIVYLGGLGRESEVLSPHLASRQEVGRVLAGSGVPVIELRASIIIGSGSLSFEMVRSLAERLPISVVPKWAYREAQPIAVEDVIAFLTEAATVPGDRTRVVEIGGPDRLSYVGLMREYARQRGLTRWFIPVPVLTPWLSSLWLGLVTPLYARVGRKLIDSCRNDTVVDDPSGMAEFTVRPRSIAEAVRRALTHEDDAMVATRWSDSASAAGERRAIPSERLGRRLIDSRATWVQVPPERAFVPIRRIGGERGWYAANFLWSIRGAIDLLSGGVGMRRGRPDPEHLAPGDALDCWRVEAIEPDQRLLLRAEMRIPGRAWLQFEVTPDRDGSRIQQTAVFDPLGVAGRAYWYGIWPLHQWVFGRMLAGIARAAQEPKKTTPRGAPSRQPDRAQPHARIESAPTVGACMERAVPMAGGVEVQSTPTDVPVCEPMVNAPRALSENPRHDG